MAGGFKKLAKSHSDVFSIEQYVVEMKFGSYSTWPDLPYVASYKDTAGRSFEGT